MATTALKRLGLAKETLLIDRRLSTAFRAMLASILLAASPLGAVFAPMPAGAAGAAVTECQRLAADQRYYDERIKALQNELEQARHPGPKYVAQQLAASAAEVQSLRWRIRTIKGGLAAGSKAYHGADLSRALVELSDAEKRYDYWTEKQAQAVAGEFLPASKEPPDGVVSLLNVDLKRYQTERNDLAKAIAERCGGSAPDPCKTGLVGHRQLARSVARYDCKKAQGNASASSVAGTWGSSIGFNYTIVQSSASSFSWSVTNRPDLNESATGHFLSSTSITASWTNSKYSGSGTGRLSLGANGRATRIDWSNGVVFTRP